MAAPDRSALLNRWEALGASFSTQGPAWTAEGRRLLRHWSLWPRAYHDTHHLQACLDHWEAARSGAGDGRNAGHAEAMDDPQAVALALWFHDAVYWPWSGRNEERSARWARRFLQGQGLPAATVDTVERHILATRHGHPAAAAAGDDRWVLDIDLAILGQPPAVYAAFERNVRREYRFVRWPRYRAGRCAVLRSFLERPALYETEWFRSRYEAQARVNLAHALDVLGGGGAF